MTSLYAKGGDKYNYPSGHLQTTSNCLHLYPGSQLIYKIPWRIVYHTYPHPGNRHGDYPGTLLSTHGTFYLDFLSIPRNGEHAHEPNPYLKDGLTVSAFRPRPHFGTGEKP